MIPEIKITPDDYSGASVAGSSSIQRIRHSAQSRAAATASLPTIATALSANTNTPPRQPKPFLRGRGFVGRNEPTRRRTTPSLDEIRLRVLQKQSGTTNTSRHVSDEGQAMILRLGRRVGSGDSVGRRTAAAPPLSLSITTAV